MISWVDRGTPGAAGQERSRYARLTPFAAMPRNRRQGCGERAQRLAVDFLWQDITHAPFWIGVFQIIFVNIILSGDNAVVIAMACLTLPPKQRLWGMVLGAGVAVLLRVIFTLLIAQAM